MVSKLTWGLQCTKENTGGISPRWQPSKNPQLETCASARRDKARVYRSAADLSTFTVGIYSALCNENLHFKRAILQLEWTRAANERGEGERAGDFCAFRRHWDVFLLQIPSAGDSASGLFVDILCRTDFFSCWYIVASTVCALLMVFKAIDMWQLSCFTVNHQKVIT